MPPSGAPGRDVIGPAAGSRAAPLEIAPDEFRRLGHELVDRLAELLEAMPRGRVTSGESPADIRRLLGSAPLPEGGRPPAELLAAATELLAAHSLFNGHPRFWGFITASAAPIGALADLLASTVNPNVGGFMLSPAATEIERQTVQWIAEMLRYRPACGGLLVSGGNLANLVGFWVGRRVRSPGDVRAAGLVRTGRQLRVYASAETHTWVQKAADLSGLGTEAIRWVPTRRDLTMDVEALRRAVLEDRSAGDLPVIVVGTAGSVSTGAIDPLREIAAICRDFDLWFHVDGAYGAPAAVLPEAGDDLHALALADSLAVDPHKWLYAPLEAGCVLVRDPDVLRDTFSYHPPYYPDTEQGDGAPIFYHEYGPQNSRGFRALKVWLALQQVGRAGYEQMIREDVALARRLYDHAVQHESLEAYTHGLSITTFRFVPPDLRGESAPGGAAPPRGHAVEAYLDRLNRLVAERMQREGEAFLTHAVVDGRFVLRACVVNFRTAAADIDALPPLVVRLGTAIDAVERPQGLGARR